MTSIMRNYILKIILASGKTLLVSKSLSHGQEYFEQILFPHEWNCKAQSGNLRHRQTVRQIICDKNRKMDWKMKESNILLLEQDFLVCPNIFHILPVIIRRNAAQDVQLSVCLFVCYFTMLQFASPNYGLVIVWLGGVAR